MAELEKALQSWSDSALISPVLLEAVKWIPDYYIPYALNYDRAMATLERCRKNEMFARVLDAGSHVKAVKKLDLFGFLIMPIQRCVALESVFLWLK